MSEAGRSVIDGMMGYLGEMATLLVGDQPTGTAIRTGSDPRGASSRAPPVVADRGGGNESRLPAVIAVWD